MFTFTKDLRKPVDHELDTFEKLNQTTNITVGKQFIVEIVRQKTEPVDENEDALK
jgi:hypothetical protein